VTKKWARTTLSRPAFTGVSRQHLGDLIEESAKPWCALREAELHERRGRERLRAAGAGPKQELVFTDRVVLTLVHLRTSLPHAALAELYGVGRSTVSEAIGEIRPLLARRGFAVLDRPGFGCTPWRTCSPTPPPKASPCASTAWRPRSASQG
jgi:hypothetical protein